MPSINFLPGVVTAPSEAEATGSWREVNLVRWDNGVMEPIGPWERYGYATAPESDIRKIHEWRDNSNRQWIAYLCDGHVYVEYDGDLFDISPTPAIVSPDTDLTAGGYGDDTYDEDDFGDGRDTRPARKNVGPCFSINNWGENLLVMVSSDGRLIQWEPSVPLVPAEVVAGAPTNNHSFIVTPERHVQLFGAAGDPDAWAWCDEEDIEDWDYADIASKAGTYNIEPASPIIASEALGENGNLFFTSKKAYVNRWIGLPGVYSQGEEIGEGVAPISPASLTRVLGGAMWASLDGFWGYNGGRASQISCQIWPWIKDNIDWEVARYTAMSVNMSDLSEFWWFFPSGEDMLNDRLAIHNYRDGWWSMGRIGRTAGIAGSLTTDTIMADRRKVYKHFSGTNYVDTTELPWLESFTVNVEEGGKFTTLRQLEPEITGDSSPVRFSVAAKDVRTPKRETYTPKRSVQVNGMVDMFITAKDFRLRIDHVLPSITPWRVGPINFDARIRGKKL